MIYKILNFGIGFNYSIEYLTKMIKEGVKLNDDQIKLIDTALGYLLDYTDYISKKDLISLELPIKYLEIPIYRHLSASLAHSLYEKLKEKKSQIPNNIERWETNIKKDPLPDIKRLLEIRNDLD